MNNGKLMEDKLKKILLIEDNVQMQLYVTDFLKAQNYHVQVLEDYDNLLFVVESYNPDLILLDINLPKYDGFFYLKQIKKNFETPVIIVSARSDESEQILGIESGAVDYITKPFSINILLAKINRLLDNNVNRKTIKSGNLEIDLKTFKATTPSASVDLTKNELQILIKLIDAEQTFVSRNELLELLWNNTDFIDDNTLTVNITRLRKKLEAIDLTDVIVNKRGVGYAYITNKKTFS